jgi:hypothetical protein
MDVAVLLRHLVGGCSPGTSAQLVRGVLMLTEAVWNRGGSVPAFKALNTEALRWLGEAADRQLFWPPDSDLGIAAGELATTSLMTSCERPGTRETLPAAC